MSSFQSFLKLWYNVERTKYDNVNTLWRFQDAATALEETQLGEDPVI